MQLLDVFRQLDSWGIVYLNDLRDIRLRKKLRHLFRALFVSEVRPCAMSTCSKVFMTRLVFSFGLNSRHPIIRLKALSQDSDLPAAYV